MLHVDNSGKGNCMYYAYSISLMYFLRAKKDPVLSEGIFNTLKLQEHEKVSLRTLLSKKLDQEFSAYEIKRIIEPILGRASRNLASEHTKKEFQRSPQDTPLFTSAHYGLEFCFKRAMQLKDVQLHELISHEFVHQDYTHAEIYKVRNMDVAMTLYSISRVHNVVDTFNSQWNAKVLELIQQHKELTESEIKKERTTLLDNILRNETVQFFISEGRDLYILPELPESLEGYKSSYLFIKKKDTRELYYIKSDGSYEKANISDFKLFEEKINAIIMLDDTRVYLSEEQIKEIITSNGGYAQTEEKNYLNHYVNHLQNEGIWGSDETLFVLHRAIQGERFERNAEGRIDTYYDSAEIRLNVHRYGALSSQSDGSEIVLINVGNTHWTSIIPESIFDSKLSAEERKLQQILDKIQIESECIKAPDADDQWIKAFREQLELIKESPTQEDQAKAVGTSMQLIGTVITRLGSYPAYWGALLVELFSSLVDFVSKLFTGKKMSTELPAVDLLVSMRQRSVINPSPSHTDKDTSDLKPEIESQFSQHTLFSNTSSKDSQNTYPKEIAQIVRESKQTGPSVARALRTLYQKGLEGHEAYLPEHCKEIAQQYLRYVHLKHRHYVLTEIHDFIKEMDAVIRQKEDSAEELFELEHVTGATF